MIRKMITKKKDKNLTKYRNSSTSASRRCFALCRYSLNFQFSAIITFIQRSHRSHCRHRIVRKIVVNIIGKKIYLLSSTCFSRTTIQFPLPLFHNSNPRNAVKLHDKPTIMENSSPYTISCLKRWLMRWRTKHEEYRSSNARNRDTLLV